LPYHQVGAPWLDTVRVLARLQSHKVPGVRFSAVRFTPRAPGDQKFADTLLAGIRFTMVDRAAYDPTLAAVTLLAVIQEIHPDRIGFNPRQFDRLAGGPALRESIQRGEKPETIVSGWAPALKAFRDRARPFLIYP